MATLINGLEMIVAFVVLLGVIVFIHEFGHFIVAKAFKIKVVTFSLGFPPKMFGFKWGETEYCISWIPLGGYCAMLGEAGENDEISPEDLPRCYCNQAWWKRALVLVAGPCMNLILPIFIYFFVFCGTHQEYTPTIGYVAENSAAARAGIQAGDIILETDGNPVATFEAMQKGIQKSSGKLALKIKRGSDTFDVELVPDTVTDTDILGDTSIKKRIGVALLGQKAMLAIEDHDSPAYLAGLRSGDQVVAVNGVEAHSWNNVRQLISASPAGHVALKVERPASETGPAATLEFVVDAVSDLPPNYPREALSSAEPDAGYYGFGLANVTIARLDDGDTPAKAIGLQVGDRLLSMDGVNINFWELDLPRVDVTNERTIKVSFLRGRELHEVDYQLKRIEPDYLANPKKEAERDRFGAYNYLGDYEKPAMVDVSFGIIDSIGYSLQKVWADIVLTYRSLGKLITGKVSMDTMGGPIMIFFVAGEAVEHGLAYFFSIMAFISINIGLLNLLPVPPLDGGHFVGVVAEAVLQRPLNPRVKEVVQMIGMVLLLLLMIVAFKNDAIRYFIR